MKTRILFLLSLYLVITLTLTAFPQLSVAGDGTFDPPISDSIPPDTTIQSSTSPTSPDGTVDIDYWIILQTIITIGI